MKASRGMGAIMPSKMPGKKIIHRKDKPQDVEMYAKGGKVKKFNGSEGSEVKSGTVVKEGADIPRYKNQMYWEEPSFAQKRMIDAKELASDAGDAFVKMFDVYGIKRKQEDARLRAADKKAKGGKVGLYENIHKKRARMAAGSGEKMRKPGSKGAPSKADFIKSAKTAKKG